MLAIEDIDTNLGNIILDQLKLNGWKVTAQYSPFAFDKGIDFDSYTLRKGSETLEFEWDNWFEWKIAGAKPTIKMISMVYSLKTK
jgi:hypothetical protein